MKRIVVLTGGLIGIAICAFAFTRPAERIALFNFTGEEKPQSQLRALYNMAIDLTRPALQLAPESKINHDDVNPFGVNTFLQGEVEPAKREHTLQMIHEVGFSWIRQQFAWSDIEIHGKGDYQDRRNEPYRSAWDKYDNIVALADQNHLKIIARLDAPPRWSHEGYADLGDFGPPAKFENYADFVGAVVERYKGRIQTYQLLNEPNIYPEWGNQRVNPEDYARMLCLAYDRAKQIDPSVVIVAAALAPTVAQDGRDFNDLIYFHRMYIAGAGRCFDVMSAQGYGLWSGPGDHRRNPLQTNIARHVFLRDIMVRNGDANKPIWLSEMNWNPVPDEPGIQGRGDFGIVTPEEQARYVPLAYERARAEWPWIGIMSIWFFKRPSDSERNQSWYYFRMVEPDFTPTPLYGAMKTYIAGR